MSTRCHHAVLLALLVAVGVTSLACAARSREARTVDPGRLAIEPGWIVAAPTPEIRQRHGAEGGAAALAMVAGRWLVPMTLDDALAVTPVTHDLGVADLNEAARASGLQAFSVGNDPDVLEFELRAHRPVIIGLLRRAPDGVMRVHYEVAVAIRPTTNEIVTIDPASGWRVRRLRDLDEEWRPAGRPALIVVGRTAESQELVPRPPRVEKRNVAYRHRPEAWP